MILHKYKYKCIFVYIPKCVETRESALGHFYDHVDGGELR